MRLFRTIRQTWALAGASWHVLRLDPRLLVFPALSGISLALIVASFWWPLAEVHLWTLFVAHGEVLMGRFYALLFLFYLVTYASTTFFNAALVACATLHMAGETPSLRQGLAIAWRRRGAILGWALLASTVGVVLQMIRERAGWLVSLIAGVAGTAWGVVSFLVVPVMVVEDCSARAALRRSTALVRDTWGHQLSLNLGFGTLTVLLILPLGVGPLLLREMGAGQETLMAALVAAALGAMVLMLVTTTLHTITRAALYLFVRHDRVPAGFTTAQLGDAVEG